MRCRMDARRARVAFPAAAMWRWAHRSARGGAWVLVAGLLTGASVPPGEVASLVKRGLAAYIDGRARTALNYFYYATTLDPSDPNAQKMLKLVAHENPSLQYKEKLTPGMNWVEHKVYKAMQDIEEDRYTLAAAGCSDVLEIEPDNVRAMTRLGAAWYALGQKDQAREMWRKAQSIWPAEGDAAAFLGSETPDPKHLTPTAAEQKAMGGAAAETAFQQSMNFYRSRAAAGARPEERVEILRRIVEKYATQGVDLALVKADLAEQEKRIAAQVRSEEARRKAAAAEQAADSKAQQAAREAFETDLSQYRLTASTLNKTARREALEKIILKHRAAGVDTRAAVEELEKAQAAPW